MARAAAALAIALVTLAAGCGGDDESNTKPAAGPPQPDRTAVPLSVGPDRRWRPPPLSDAARAGRPVNRMRCTRGARPRFGVHLELFARRHVVIVPPGIGVAPPHGRRGAYVRRGRCSYPLRTREPTGVIEVEPGRARTLGDLFALWGRRLARTRLAAFRGPVAAYVGGRPWRHDPRAIPLRPHAQIVLEVGGHVPPHTGYSFPPGL